MDAVKTSLGKLKTFLQCPLKYKMAHIDLIPADTKTGSGLSFYQSLHDSLTYFHKEGTSPIPPESFLLNLLDRNWHSGGYKDAAEEKQFRGLAENILKEFYASFQEENPDVKYTTVMVKFKTKRAIISSRVDRIDLLPDGTYEVINYKTGKSALEPIEMARDLQAITLYQGANSHKRFEGKVSRVSFYYLRPNRKVSISPSVEDVKEVTAQIDQIVRSIEKLAKGKSLSSALLGKILPGDKGGGNEEAALAEKGALCGNCEYLEKCPAWPITPRQIAEETPEVFAERIRLSYSKLSSYKRCPRAWKKSYLDGMFSMEPRPFFSFGTALHEAMENFYSPHGAKKGSLKHLLSLWEEAFENNREGYRDDEEADKYFQKGVEQLEKYHAHYCADGKYHPADAIEEYFAVPLGKNAVMTGFIDRIDKLEDGTYEILDYKTEPTMREQKAVDEDDQLTIYFWACETLFKMKIKQLALLMTNFDKKIVTTRKTEDIPEVVAAIDATAAEMKENIRLYREHLDPDQKESEYFPPKKNKYCKSCDFLEDCPLRPEIEGDTSIRTMEYDDLAEEKPMPTLEYE